LLSDAPQWLAWSENGLAVHHLTSLGRADVAPIQDTDSPIRRYFIFQNQGYADMASVYIINNK
jgi:hypothetical protein